MTGHLSPERLVKVRELLEEVNCCDLGPDIGIENWGGKDGRTHRMTEHCQVPMARCSFDHEGFFHPKYARLIAYGVNSLPDILAALDAAEERAEAAEGALARVEALADHWDEVADMWPYAHWHDSQKANARELREVMKDQS